ncbi:hypothetical protein [Polynucleobacter sp. AP-Kaivos-20-H2]|uniref:hypothetical protein n=1 Tax=Polynucleobacter sp. AP-Kaivos-20-H2 TaxID=2689104 RepID=UPI001C0BF7A3|nr:hypothetical protein [Polynucleobacter sp. AP-Kaivos-20-H2]MBU3602896.1 hypothetical protein [Polynucleobacter sp. AP-Kaivos-20-H2]
MKDELIVGKHYTFLRQTYQDYFCESVLRPCVTFLRMYAGLTASSIMQNIRMSSKSATR